MKKNIIYLIAIFLIAGFSSCKKTNTRKLTGDWTLSTMDETTSSTSSGNTTTEVISISGTTVTITNTDQSGTTTSDGVLNSATWTISKDGTYSRDIDLSIDFSGSGFEASVNSIMNETGTWSFVGKNKSAELKANDRVVFNTLSNSNIETTSYTIAGVTTSDTETSGSTYAEGESAETFIVQISKSKELTLTQDESSTSTLTTSSGTSNASTSKSSTYSLIQE